MTKEYHSKKIYTVIGILVAVCIVFVLVYNAGALLPSTVHSAGVSFDSGWTMDAEGQISQQSLPVSYIGAEDQKITLSHAFADKTLSGSSLCLQVYSAPFSVYVDDVLIYQYGQEAIAQGYSSVGSGYHIIPLPESGHTVRIVFELPAGSDGFILTDATVMPGADYLIRFIRQHIFTIIAFVILFAVFIYVIISRGLRAPGSNRSTSAFVCMALCTAVWVVARSGLLQIFIDNLLVVNAIDFLSFFLLPLTVIFFVKKQFHMDDSRILNTLLAVGAVFFFGACILHTLQIVDFTKTLIVFHPLLAIDMILLIFSIFHKKDAAIPVVLKAGVAVLVISGALEMALYYVLSFRFLRFSVLEIGLLAFTLSMLYLWNVESKNVRLQLRRQSIFKRMAFTDELTGLDNRTSFEQRISVLSTIERRGVYVVMIDLNGLKLINDTQGHTAGDEFIRQSAGALQEIVDGSGQLFRIGGDEFIALLECSDKQAAFIIKKLEPYLRKNDGTLSPSFAIGYSFFDPAKDEDLNTAFRRADKRMYLCKQNIYSPNKKNL